MGRDAPPDEAAAQRGDGQEARVERVGARRAGGQDQVDRVRPPDEAGHRRLDRLGVVVDVLDGLDRRAEALDLGAHAGLEPRACGRPDRLLDEDADPARDERRDPDERVAAEAGQPRPGVDRRGIDQVRGDLDAGDEVAARDDLAVERGEDLERVDPVERARGRRSGRCRTPAASAMRSTRLWFGPRLVSPGPATAAASRMRRLVLVELARPRARGR